jgi:response regulator NasT
MLREMGHEVVGAAADGPAALQLLADTRPDLAILDIKMPGMDGLAVAEAISARQALPVVMLTAYSERDLVERATATEAVQAYLVKPVREADLAPVLDLAVARFAEWQVLRAEASGLHEALLARDVLARAKQMLMAQRGLSEREAFLEIQQRARRERQPMDHVAELILADPPG